MKNRKTHTIFIFIAVICILSACAGTAQNTYHTRVGEAASSEIIQKANIVLLRYGYQVARFDNDANTIAFETEWLYNYGLEDMKKADKNIQALRTRIFLMAREYSRARSRSAIVSGRGGSIGHFPVQALYMTGEAEGQYEDRQKWIQIPVTGKLAEHFQSFQEELSKELRIARTMR